MPIFAIQSPSLYWRKMTRTKSVSIANALTLILRMCLTCRSNIIESIVYPQQGSASLIRESEGYLFLLHMTVTRYAIMTNPNPPSVMANALETGSIMPTSPYPMVKNVIPLMYIQSPRSPNPARK